ncbi:response regulator [Streptomyces canus]
MSGKNIDWKGAGVRIMIADDEAAIRESLERVLQVEGYDTSTVANGLAVLDGVGGADGDTLDLLILDVMMPRLGGLETCRRLRAAGRDLPVLMLTARDQVSDRVTGLDAGADDYRPKPFATESCWPGCGPCCAGARRPTRSRRSCRSPTSGSIPTGSRRGGAGGRCA